MKRCEDCLQKQIRIEQLQDENRLLKVKLRRHERKQQEGYFGISTSSSKVSFKSNADEEKTNRKGGARAGHVGCGRDSCSEETADKVITIEGDNSVLTVENSCNTKRRGNDGNGKRTAAAPKSESKKNQKAYYRDEQKPCSASGHQGCSRHIHPKWTQVAPIG